MDYYIFVTLSLIHLNSLLTNIHDFLIMTNIHDFFCEIVNVNTTDKLLRFIVLFSVFFAFRDINLEYFIVSLFV